jgi:hypothetical protein
VVAARGEAAALFSALTIERLFAFDSDSEQGAFLGQADVFRGLGDDGEQRAERCFRTRGVDLGREVTILAAGIAGSLDLIDNRIRVRPQQDFVQDLVIDVRTKEQVDPIQHRVSYRSRAAGVEQDRPLVGLSVRPALAAVEA